MVTVHFTESSLFEKENKIGCYSLRQMLEKRASIMCENQLRGLDAVCHTELEKTTIDVINEGI